MTKKKEDYEEKIEEIDKLKNINDKYFKEKNELNKKNFEMTIERDEIDRRKTIKITELNRLNDRYEQRIQELEKELKELNDKDISLNQYKKELDILYNRHKKNKKQKKN